MPPFSLLAGCGGAKKGVAPELALLTGVDVQASKVVFTFQSPPQAVAPRWVTRSQLVESGSGKPVPLRGSAYLVVHFRPAATGVADANGVMLTYTGPKRIEGPGPVLEIAKTSDFEADLAWAIGLERKLPVHVERDGKTVTVEGLDAASEVFASFVNFDTYGTEGVRDLLVRVRAILAGTAPPLDEQRNTYEIVSDEVTTRVAFRDESASCATTEFAAFLDEILSRLDALVDN